MVERYRRGRAAHHRARLAARQLMPSDWQPSGPRGLAGDLDAQAHNLSEVRQLPEFALVEQVAELYERSLEARPRDPDLRFLQLLIICNHALLSCAGLIARAVPGDAIPITRRAIEAACLAAAIKADPANYDRWLAGEERMKRWRDRDQGIRPKSHVGGVQYPATVNELRALLGILSDAGAHLTPEFISTQHVRIERDATPARVYIGYFETSQPELERALLYLGSVHLKILDDVFVSVFDGAFHRHAAWVQLREEITRRARPLVLPLRRDAETSVDAPDDDGAGE